MAEIYQQENTAWRRDRSGAYVEFAQNTDLIEVSINFENQLQTSEVINSVTATSDSIDINTSFPFFLPGREGNYQLAVIQFLQLDNDPGVYPVAVAVTTNHNRVYKRHFRIKIT